VPCPPLPSFLQSSELRRYPLPNSRQTGAVRDVGSIPPTGHRLRVVEGPGGTARV
jgi:hypothetical protein